MIGASPDACTTAVAASRPARGRGGRRCPTGRWWSGFALLVLLACGAAGDAGPRALVPGVDVCEYCHMAVDDQAVAAQWVPAVGPAHLFDEPGCLIAWLQANPDAVGQAFVGGEANGEWVAAEEAVFTVGAVRTAMGFDIRAHPSAAEAMRLLEEGRGERLTWVELIERGVDDAHEH